MEHLTLKQIQKKTLLSYAYNFSGSLKLFQNITKLRRFLPFHSLLEFWYKLIGQLNLKTPFIHLLFIQLILSALLRDRPENNETQYDEHNSCPDVASKHHSLPQNEPASLEHTNPRARAEILGRQTHNILGGGAHSYLNNDRQQCLGPRNMAGKGKKIRCSPELPHWWRSSEQWENVRRRPEGGSTALGDSVLDKVSQDSIMEKGLLACSSEHWADTR